MQVHHHKKISLIIYKILINNKVKVIRSKGQSLNHIFDHLLEMLIILLFMIRLKRSKWKLRLIIKCLIQFIRN